VVEPEIARFIGSDQIQDIEKNQEGGELDAADDDPTSFILQRLVSVS